MRPEGTACWRKDGRTPRRRDQEPSYYPPALLTVRQQGQLLADEAEEMLALDARARRNGLASLVEGLPGVTVIRLEEMP